MAATEGHEGIDRVTMEREATAWDPAIRIALSRLYLQGGRSSYVIHVAIPTTLPADDNAKAIYEEPGIAGLTRFHSRCSCLGDSGCLYREVLTARDALSADAEQTARQVYALYRDRLPEFYQVERARQEWRMAFALDE